MKTIVLALLVAATAHLAAAAPLDLQSLKKIIASDHSDKPLHKQLQIYPNAREYSITTKVVAVNGREHNTQFKGVEKHVEGLYIVSEATPAGPESKFFMVVEYDDEEQIYRKYLLSGGKVSDIHVGTRIGDSNVISWHDLTPDPNKPGLTQMMLEEHTKDQSTWKSVYLREGKLLGIETGTATPKK